MRNAILVALVMLCACSPTGSEISRVAIPETPLSVAVMRDEKGLYRYRILENGVPVTAERIFGGSSTDGPLEPVIAEGEGTVRISWTQKGLEVAFLEFDRDSGQIAKDSNLTGGPPPIELMNSWTTTQP